MSCVKVKQVWFGVFAFSDLIICDISLVGNLTWLRATQNHLYPSIFVMQSKHLHT